jgi:hypothetical protein
MARKRKRPLLNWLHLPFRVRKKEHFNLYRDQQAKRETDLKTEHITQVALPILTRTLLYKKKFAEKEKKNLRNQTNSFQILKCLKI